MLSRKGGEQQNELSAKACEDPKKAGRRKEGPTTRKGRLTGKNSPRAADERERRTLPSRSKKRIIQPIKSNHPVNGALSPRERRRGKKKGGGGDRQRAKREGGLTSA